MEGWVWETIMAMFDSVTYDDMCIYILKIVWSYIPSSYNDIDFMVTIFNEFQPAKQDSWCQ